jgi:hypothetical protein
MARVNEKEAIWHKTKDIAIGMAFSRKENAHKVSVSKPVGNTSVVVSEVDGGYY